MPEPDLRVLENAYQALNAGDAQAALHVLDADAEWHESSYIPDTGVYRGRAAIGAWLREFLESWEEFHQEVEEMFDAGDRVVLFLHLVAKGKLSGAIVDARYAHVWTMRNGKGTRVDGYVNREEALEAAREAVNP